MERRHHRHGEARQQHKDVRTHFATENSEFVLQTNRVEAAGIQEICGACVRVNIVGLDLQSDRRRIIVNLTMVGHGNDACLKSGVRGRYGLLKMGCESGYPAAAGQRIADEGDTADWRHDRTSISANCGRETAADLMEHTARSCNKEAIESGPG